MRIDMTLQKALPVVTSIGLILLVALLRERSRTAAAIFASMPINIPLALWVVFGSGGAGPVDPGAEATFLRNIGVGLITTLVWVLIVFAAIKLGVSLLPAVIFGYAIWGTLTVLWFRIGLLQMG